MRPHWAAYTAAVVAAVALTTTAVAQATPLHRTPRVLTSVTGSLGWKPRQIVYTGDGSGFMAGTPTPRQHLIWTSWTTRQGRGRGATWIDTCTPDCAQGRDVAYPMKIRVYRPERVAGHLVFTRMTTTFTDGFPPYPGYRHRSVTYRLIKAGHGHVFWSIP